MYDKLIITLFIFARTRSSLNVSMLVLTIYYIILLKYKFWSSSRKFSNRYSAYKSAAVRELSCKRNYCVRLTRLRYKADDIGDTIHV